MLAFYAKAQVDREGSEFYISPYPSINLMNNGLSIEILKQAV